jgi:protein-tyrosine phosphatase
LIDLHCHILSGIDDGPATPEGSMELARALVADGVRTVAATPHLRSDFPAVVPNELADRCRELQGWIDSEGLLLTVVPAGEVELSWALEASQEDLRSVSFGGRGTDLLVETPYGPLPSTFEELLFRVAVQGIRILLAHPERNPTFQDQPDRLASVVERGAFLQVTASSLTRSRRGSGSAKLARNLLQDGLAHVIASDSHGAGTFGRSSLGAGLNSARRVVGRRADWMVRAAPAAILDGRPLATPPPAARSGLLRRLTS